MCGGGIHIFLTVNVRDGSPIHTTTDKFMILMWVKVLFGGDSRERRRLFWASSVVVIQKIQLLKSDKQNRHKQNKTVKLKA